MPDINTTDLPGNCAIELTGVAVTHYEGATEDVLVRDVNWRIEFGDFWVVGGRRSCGKSSLLLAAAGMNRPAAGALRVLGQDLSGASEKDQMEWRRRIGFVFELGGRLFSHLTVAQNIALPLRYHHPGAEADIVARVNALLALTELQQYAQYMPSRLSLEAQQRVALARALTAPVEVLFLDSPLTPLAWREMRWWLDFLKRLRDTQRVNERPLTLVASADDFRGWLDVATQFAIVEGGRFRALGGQKQVAATAEPDVREFLATEI